MTFVAKKKKTWRPKTGAQSQILNLITSEVKVPKPQIFIPEVNGWWALSSWLLNEAESRFRERMREGLRGGLAEKLRAWAVERGGPGLLPCFSCLSRWEVNSGVERIRENERQREAESREKGKIFRVWIVLFVLICDCFVVNLLDRISSLSGWFLVCLEDNNV